MKEDTIRHIRRPFRRTKNELRRLRSIRRNKVANRRKDERDKNNILVQRLVKQEKQERVCYSDYSEYAVLLQSLTLQQIKSNLFPLLEDPAVVNIPLVDRLDNLNEFQNIQDMFSNTSHEFEVTEISKVRNPYLRVQYELKKIQVLWKYGSVSEKLLFHGTLKDNITSICQNNFNWRLYKKHKYGIGVNFATTPSYAAHYCDEDADKVMIVSKVIIGHCCYWSKSMPWPPEPHDTVISRNECVVVKFEDHSFYPEYLVHFRNI